MEYEELRRTYPQFIYEGYKADFGADTLSITYHFRIPGLSEFTPRWLFPTRRRLTYAEQLRTRNMIFHLGLAEIPSYWKTVCSPTVLVRAGAVDERQAQWWQNLLFHGMGEFYHLNGLPRQLADMPAFVSQEESLILPPESQAARYGGALIPVGGGKDSLVTLSHNPEAASDCFLVNPKPSALLGASIAGYESERVLTARRSLDSRLLDLNSRGFLNGHTPFSALLAFASVLCAYINGHTHVVLSNEQSANEPTTADGANHQYSKSFAFERDFSAYLTEYLTDRVRYFSFLRPISELQIAALFASQPRYHAAFRSCNKGSREDKWCAACPKCLFVYIILSPFLSPTALRGIFGADLWENEALADEFDALTGVLPTKPFECVGSRDEVNAALGLCLHRYYKDVRRPFLLARYAQSELCVPTADHAAHYRGFYSAEHQLPPAYDAALKKALEECAAL